MDRENDRNERKNLWEKQGRRGGLAESEGVKKKTGGSRYSRREESAPSGSRYSRREEKAPTGSRYSRREESTLSGSRYSRGEESAPSGSRYSRGEKKAPSGSRYSRREESAPSGSRYSRREESAPSGSRYSRRKENTPSGSCYSRGEAAAALSGKSGRERQPGKRRFSIGRDPVKIAFASLGAVLILAYIVVAFYFGGHFYSGSSIYGIDCSRKTSEQVKNEVKDKIGDYVLTVEGRNGISDKITAAQINLQYHDENGIEKEMRRQHSYVWPAMMLFGKSNDLQIGTVYDRENMDSVLKQMNSFLPGNVVAPRDAYRGDTEEGYEVVPEVMGTTLNYDKTKEVIMQALDQGAVSVSLEEKGCYIDPVVYQDDPELNAEVEELNALLKARITYDFSDRQEVVDASVIKNWIFQDENGAYYIDDAYIWDYVEELAEKYDTFGRDRVFYTSIGTTVNLTGGDYGWCIDQGATGEYLINAVHEGRVETIEPEYIYTGMSREENDIGGTYVEICISRQEMWCYQDGYLIVDTPVVTGNPNKGNGTPTGSVWAIDAKMTDYVLKGEGYAAPVDYWMPFNGDIGIHDMQNRAYFGGSIYLSNGSHGCVNTPYTEAQTIYNIVSIGTPVIVYD